MSQASAHETVCLVSGPDGREPLLEECLRSLRRHTPATVELIAVEHSSAAVNDAAERLAPADVVLFSEPCEVAEGWLARLRDAACADTNTASASALADAGTALAVPAEETVGGDLDSLAERVSGRTLRLLPRLQAIVGPCSYLRREALQLVGPLDVELELRWALEVDFAQRCLLAGLCHVACDDLVVARLADSERREEDPPAQLRERYPYLYEAGEGDAQAVFDGDAGVAGSGALARALQATRGARSPFDVTIDGRALRTAMTGTQRHILELIKALAATEALRLRVLIDPETSAETLAQLRALEGVALLGADEIGPRTERSTIFHRPQQVFGVPDLRFALRLGERLVVNQLDLIAYHNPGYHADGRSWRRYRRIGRQALAVADRVVVSSEHTRGELLSDELSEAERVRVVPPGLDHPQLAGERVPAALADERPAADDGLVSEPFMFCLGTDFRHKNRVFALELLGELRERHEWPGRLLFAGVHVPQGSSREAEQELLRERPPLRAAVTDLGPIDEGEKAWLMQRAAAVVYPSTYEGFGLVPLEAALNGVPCMFAAQSSLAEVLPRSAATIVPWDVSESAQRAYELLEDPGVRRRHLAALAAVAARFTWSAAAAAMVEVYREAALAPIREAAALSRDEIVREHELHDLVLEQDALVAQLVREREHARGMYDSLNAEVGFGLSLIGPHGRLPEDVQRALLALSAKPSLSRSLFAGAARAYRAARALRRVSAGSTNRTR